MVSKGGILLLLFLIFGIFSVYLLIKPSDIKSQDLFERKFVKTLYADKELTTDFISYIYRLYSSEDSILFLSEKGVFITKSDLSFVRQIEGLNARGNLFYLKKSKDTLAYLDYDKKTLNVVLSGSALQDSIHGRANNGIFQDSFFYHDIIKNDWQVAENKDLETDYSDIVIESWNPFSGKKKKEISINGIVKNEIKGFEQCLENTLEGNFYPIGNNKWIFLFYRAGYFLVFNAGNFSLLRTIDKSPFRKYEYRDVKQGGISAYMCYSENDFFDNYAAAGDDSNIYILSGKTIITKTQGWHSAIDVYDKGSFQYKHSYFVPMKGKENFANQMTILNDCLYLFVNGEGLKRYKIN